MKITQYNIEDLGWKYKKRDNHGDYLTVFYFEKEELDKDNDSEYYLQHELRYFKFRDKSVFLVRLEVVPSHYEFLIEREVDNLEDFVEFNKNLI